MGSLTTDQRIMLLDLIDSVIDRGPVLDHHLSDAMVVFQFLNLAKEMPDVVYHFVKLVPVDYLCRFTQRDILPEEVMLELHCEFGFSVTELAQWLRGLNYGGFSFFVDAAKARDVLNLDIILLRARQTHHMVDGVFFTSVSDASFSLEQLVDYALSERIKFHQFRDILAQLHPSDDEINDCLNGLINDHRIFSQIKQSSQILPFRVFCAFFDFFNDNPKYLTGISQVFDQLIQSSSVEKSIGLLNDFPFPIIDLMIQRFIKYDVRLVIDHLNQMLPQFRYGSIRKIVRRGALGLTYRYD